MHLVAESNETRIILIRMSLENHPQFFLFCYREILSSGIYYDLMHYVYSSQIRLIYFHYFSFFFSSQDTNVGKLGIELNWFIFW